MAESIELYERLKRTLDEETARMVVNRLGTAEELATKSDLQDLEAATREDIQRLEAATREDIQRLERLIIEVRNTLSERMAQLETRVLRWQISFFVPLWIAVLGALIAVLVKA